MRKSERVSSYPTPGTSARVCGGSQLRLLECRVSAAGEKQRRVAIKQVPGASAAVVYAVNKYRYATAYDFESELSVPPSLSKCSHDRLARSASQRPNSALFHLVAVAQQLNNSSAPTLFRGAALLGRQLSEELSAMADSTSVVFKTSGHCPICDTDADFVAYNTWFRDYFVCTRCGSVPRERALMIVLDSYFPKWRQGVIHECSPGRGGASQRLSQECTQYIPSQYFPDQTPGTLVENVRCENLESLSFPDDSIDLHITQDVLEHVFHPSRAFREIARTLKPGGMHICTVPLVNKGNPSKLRARIENDEIFHLEPEQYHGSPVGDGRALVTVDWGFDICRHIFEASGLFTHLIHIDDLSKGVRAEYIEVLVSVKPSSMDVGNQIP